MEFVKFIIASVLIISGIIVQFTVKQSTDVPTFFIDLDREPMERFREVAERYSFGIRILAKNYKNAVKRTYNMSFNEIDSIVKKLAKHFYQEYRDEMVGIAKYAQMDVNDVYFLHVHYELSSMCTTVICVDNENIVWMLRNFDYFRAKEMKSLTVTLDFQRGNRSLFKGTTLAGIIGVPNAVKRDSFTFSMNRRVTRSGTLEGNLRLAASQVESTGHAWPAILLVRRILDKKHFSFNQAVQELSTVPVMSPAYFIIGGRKDDEGVIITRDRNAVVATSGLDMANGTWFVLITNSDVNSEIWRKSDWRFHAVHTAMTRLIRAEMNDEKAWKVLRQSYFKKSVFSSLMSMDTYYLSTVIAS